VSALAEADRNPDEMNELADCALRNFAQIVRHR